ncbi:MAG: hypothetical protein R3D68_08410 [Hyphomicrobiaceae bacterium]
MKTLFGTLLALGLLSTTASAQYCPPGWGYGQSSYGQYRPTHGTLEKRVVEMPAAEAPATDPQAAPAPQGEEAPQAQEQAPAPETAPPK